METFQKICFFLNKSQQKIVYKVYQRTRFNFSYHNQYLIRTCSLICFLIQNRVTCR